MNACPFHSPAPDSSADHVNLQVDDMPPRIAQLPRRRWYPVPWFVGVVNADFDFRLADPSKLVRAVRGRLCWVCGQPLTRWKAFVIGPMCGINRTNAEPPAHVDCATYSARFCPFLSRPHMKRREDATTEACRDNIAGVSIRRNPGVCAVWVVDGNPGYRVFNDGQGRPLFELDEPARVEWYAEGRAATRAEVLHSIATGLPLLRAMCDQESTPDLIATAHRELLVMEERLNSYLPRT